MAFGHRNDLTCIACLPHLCSHILLCLGGCLLSSILKGPILIHPSPGSLPGLLIQHVVCPLFPEVISLCLPNALPPSTPRAGDLYAFDHSRLETHPGQILSLAYWSRFTPVPTRDMSYLDRALDVNQKAFTELSSVGSSDQDTSLKTSLYVTRLQTSQNP